jgi:D-xylulose reductase
MDEGAAIEPLSVAIHALNAVAKLPPHRNVVVFGAGPVGLMCMAGRSRASLQKKV